MEASINPWFWVGLHILASGTLPHATD